MAESKIHNPMAPVELTSIQAYPGRATILNNMSFTIGRIVIISVRMSIDMQVSQGNEILTGFPLPKTDLGGGYSTIALATSRGTEHHAISASGVMISPDGSTTTGNLIVSGAYVTY